MAVAFTETQNRRLVELDCEEAALTREFEDASSRDAAFRALERELIALRRADIVKCLDETRQVELASTRTLIVEHLTKNMGFTEVMTPTIITADMLDRMTITEEHPLRAQIYWLDGKRCLRPMLAPNLYIVMRDLMKAAKRPVRIFEAGSCFRKESKGAKHLSEFTMLNLVEYGTVKEGEQMARLREIATEVMAAFGITGYELKIEASDVYGETLDIELDGVELASGSYGPHSLDPAWGVFDTWVGLGMGLERIAMVRGGHRNIKRVGRSVTYFSGSPLNL